MGVVQEGALLRYIVAGLITGRVQRIEHYAERGRGGHRRCQPLPEDAAGIADAAMRGRYARRFPVRGSGRPL